MVIGSNRAAILIFPVELLRVRSHLLYPLFDTLRVCSPATIPTEDGVLPTKLPSISISAPKGSDEISLNALQKETGLSRNTILRARRGERVHPRSLLRLRLAERFAITQDY
jgi:hypothetical protein